MKTFRSTLEPAASETELSSAAKLISVLSSIKILDPSLSSAVRCREAADGGRPDEQWHVHGLGVHQRGFGDLDSPEPDLARLRIHGPLAPAFRLLSLSGGAEIFRV